jgi:mRNA deadenylase 3'-5' endonuclease subunit Ccr4
MTLLATTYNVLADGYLRPRYYPHTPPALLEPAPRRARIVDHVVGLDADVYCLQEVEPATFDALSAALEPRGYTGRYARKGAGRPDGCATFYRGLREHAARIVAYDDGDPPTGHVALILELEHEGRRIAVVNTHLQWEPHDTPPAERRAGRQVRQLLEACPTGACLVCGDFNATPDSAIAAEMRAAGFADPHAGLPGLFSCNANERAKRVDYLFASPALRAEPVGRFAAIADDTPLPGDDEPSDHVALSARLDFV